MIPDKRQRQGGGELQAILGYITKKQNSPQRKTEKPKKKDLTIEQLVR